MKNGKNFYKNTAPAGHLLLRVSIPERKQLECLIFTLQIALKIQKIQEE
jgi:hypothetical protein